MDARQHALAVTLASVALTLAVDRSALGAEARGDEPRMIRVGAAASASAAPDRAQIDLGVRTQAESAKQAAADNASRVDRVLDAERKTLGSKADVKTISYSVMPLYGEPKPNRSPSISGYSAENVVRVTTDDLSQVSKVIDAAMAAGANDVRGLQFSLKDEQEVRSRALREAVSRAKAQAEVIASALGVKIAGLRSVETAGEAPIVRPMMMGAAMARAGEGPPTPIEPGTIEIHANVTVAFEIAP